MIDPMVSLAFSVYSNIGVYALLLGSGISRASEIPTGWEIILDLVRKVAALEKDDCEPAPAKWYEKKYGAAPNYSKLLDEIAKTPTERQQLLRSYFEPTDDERAQGLKLPNAAHKAIAKLVVSGYVRVIITTNFDHLTEKALNEAGISPTIVSTADQLKGALPLTHSGATLIKLHGDYLDTRIKNTESELETYDPEMDKLLDRVLDEYGLIVSGWSGEWDAALRNAIKRCPIRRFTTYWTTISEPGEKGEMLINCRQAVILQTKNANQLFESLVEKVHALEDMAAPHPLSAKMAVAVVKRHLVDPTAKIRLHDLVHEETEKLFASINDPKFGGDTQLEPSDELKQRIDQYGALSETLLHVLVTGCYWGSESHSKLWVKSLQRITNLDTMSGLVYLTQLRLYPALLLLYGAGLAAIAAGNYQTLATVFLQVKIKGNRHNNDSICSFIYPYAVVGDAGRCLPGYEKRRTPLSDHLCDKLHEPFRGYLPRKEDYENIFDRFEYFLGLVHADLTRREFNDGWWGPSGCFIWRGRLFSVSISQQIGAELEAAGANWPPLKAGLFGGSLDQAKTAKAKFDKHLSGIPVY